MQPLRRVSSGDAAIEYGRLGPPCGADQHCLSRLVVERRSVQVDPDDAGARRGGKHLADAQIEDHGGLC